MDRIFQEQLIGEIEGLRATLQATLGALALYAGKDSNVLEGVHAVAHEAIRLSKFQVSGCDESAIKARAETVVDKMIGTLKIHHAG